MLDFGFTVPYNIYDQVYPCNWISIECQLIYFFGSSGLLLYYFMIVSAILIDNGNYSQVKIQFDVPKHDPLHDMKLELLHRNIVPHPKDMKDLTYPVNTFSIKFVLIPNLFVLQNHLDNIVQFLYADSWYLVHLTNIIEWFCFMNPNCPCYSWMQCLLSAKQSNGYPRLFIFNG